jgi:hypothetical protein
MQLDKYSIISSDDHKFYEFYSEGPNGKIKKVVVFSKPMGRQENIFNLAFGDWNEKQKRLNDRAISNNKDRQKILATVASTVLEFINYYPDAIVYAEGSTLSRTRLYQIGISAYLSEINKWLIVYGFRFGDWEIFQPGRNYEAFAVKIKM